MNAPRRINTDRLDALFPGWEYCLEARGDVAHLEKDGSALCIMTGAEAEAYSVGPWCGHYQAVAGEDHVELRAPNLLTLRDAVVWLQRWADDTFLAGLETGDNRPSYEYESGWWFEAQAPRPDWQMPPPPSPGATPTAEFDGDGWTLCWSPSTKLTTIPWPFAEDEAATPDQLIALGFTIVQIGGEE